jgi:hypothetical protein
LKFYEKIKRSLTHWLAHRLPHCDQLAPVISESLDHRLPLRRGLSLKLHLALCTHCVRYLRQLRFIRDVLRSKSSTLPDEAPPGDSLGAEARERVRRALDSRKNSAD